MGAHRCLCRRRRAAESPPAFSTGSAAKCGRSPSRPRRLPTSTRSTCRWRAWPASEYSVQFIGRRRRPRSVRERHLPRDAVVASSTNLSAPRGARLQPCRFHARGARAAREFPRKIATCRAADLLLSPRSHGTPDRFASLSAPCGFRSISFVLVVGFLHVAAATVTAADADLIVLPCASTASALPATVSVPDDLQRHIASMLSLSATFRAQCRRIAEASKLLVLMRLDPALVDRSYRARTSIHRTTSGDPGGAGAAQPAHRPGRVDCPRVRAHRRAAGGIEPAGARGGEPGRLADSRTRRSRRCGRSTPAGRWSPRCTRARRRQS